MAMTSLMVLVEVIGACFLWRYVTCSHEGRSAAVIANACHLWSADFLQEVVRDGDHRDVTVHHDGVCSPSYQNKGSRQNCFAIFADCISYIWRTHS